VCVASIFELVIFSLFSDLRQTLQKPCMTRWTLWRNTWGKKRQVKFIGLALFTIHIVSK